MEIDDLSANLDEPAAKGDDRATKLDEPADDHTMADAEKIENVQQK